MELSYNAKLLLALHLELFNKPYDTNCNMKYCVGEPILVNHIKMQNVCYLFQNLGIINENFEFSQNWYGTSSPGLESLLIGLDKKENSVNNFYKEYNEKRNKYYNNYQHQLHELLKEFLDEDKIKLVAKTCYLLEDIVSQEMGSETLCSIIYLSKTVYPEETFEDVNRRLIRRLYYSPSNELNREIWKCLTVLGIIKMEPKKLSIKEKTYQKN